MIEVSFLDGVWRDGYARKQWGKRYGIKRITERA